MKYFGTDGVRGIANETLTPELAFKLGRCGGYVLTQHAEGKQPRVLVARDTRISGQMLEQALIAGLLSVGIEVFTLGVMTTPGVAYLVRLQDADAGIMISASHNPVQDNGIKFFGGDGYKLSDDQEEEIEALLEKILMIFRVLLQKAWERSAATAKARSSICNSLNKRFRMILKECTSQLTVPTARRAIWFHDSLRISALNLTRWQRIRTDSTSTRALVRLIPKLWPSSSLNRGSSRCCFRR